MSAFEVFSPGRPSLPWIPSLRNVGKPASGMSMVEVSIFLLIAGILWTLVIPPLSLWWSGLRLEMAAGEMAGELHLARSYAVRNHTRVGVKFWMEADGTICQRIYRDNDGDGVRSRDIEEEIDTPVRPAHRLAGRIHFGFPPGEPPIDPSSGRPMGRLEDPVRFNRSDLASFSSDGRATPGTVYLTDGRYHLAAVRVASRSGKITVLRYDPEDRTWR